MTDDLLGGRRWRIIQGDVLEVLADEPDDSYDGCFCDPPYGYTFMGKKWDHAVPGPDYWAEVLRVLKPGAMLLVFGGTRTWHRLACAIEDAGFELRDTLMWLHGQGFPKSHDISKAIDKAAGAEREVVGYSRGVVVEDNKGYGGIARGGVGIVQKACDVPVTAPATPAAKVWEGYGTGLKPSFEPVLLAMKPLDGTFAANALKWGVAGINVDGCRIVGAKGSGQWGSDQTKSESIFGMGGNDTRTEQHTRGRWPSNLLLQHLPECERRGTKRVRGSYLDHDIKGDNTLHPFRGKHHTHNTGYADPDGLETVDDYICEPNCPVAMLDAQSGILPPAGGPKYTTHDSGMFGMGVPGKIFTDKGGASRFFRTFEGEAPCRFRYVPKSSRRERDAGLEGMPEQPRFSGGLGGASIPLKGSPMPVGRNPHPTCKPLALCEYLSRLIIPPAEYRDEAQLLVPFAGVMSEAIGAMLAGWRNVTAIELVEEYCEIGEARMAWWAAKIRETGLTEPRAILKSKAKPDLQRRLL